ncbi:oxidoreductase, partial [Nakamurella alba]
MTETSTAAAQSEGGSGDFPVLFSPIAVGPRVSRNRIINSGHGTSLAPGRHNEELFLYEETRARGGAGIVTTQSQWINQGAGDFDVRYEVASGAYDELASRVHAGGALCFIQINHPGRQGFLGPRNREYAVAPSQVPGRFYGGQVQIPHAMTEAEIMAVIEDFAGSAEAITTTAADGVEIHFGHGNLVQQFLSPHTNRRTDRWGGSFENRTRFAREVIAAIRDRIGTDTVVFGARINGAAPGDPTETTLLNDFATMLLDMDPGMRLDYLSVTGGHFSSAWGTSFNLPDSSFPPALWESQARRVREQARDRGVPIFQVGRILGPALAERLLA